MLLGSYDFDISFKYRHILYNAINIKNGYGYEKFYCYVSKQISCNRKVRINELRTLIPEMKKNQLIFYNTSDYSYFVDFNGDMAIEYKFCSRDVPKSIKKEERPIGYGWIKIYGEKIPLDGSDDNFKLIEKKLQIFDGFEALGF